MFQSLGARHAIRALAMLLLPLAAGRAAPAAPSDPHGAARAVYLLEYIGTDYAGAVRDGKVVSETEYAEILRFTDTVIREHAQRVGPDGPAGAGLAELREMIVARASVERVRSRTRELLPLLARALGGAARPASPPDLENGRSLWRRDCTPCHGASGAGDGRAAAGMDPKPAVFAGEILDHLSPRQAYGAVSFGVDGTAMPSFGEAYTEAQLWDVAFFVPTLRPGFSPAAPSPGDPALGLDELAASTNAELLTKLRAMRPDASAHDVDSLRASQAPPPDAGVDVALRLQDAFSGIAERVFPSVFGVSGYARDPGWTFDKVRSERGDGWMAANPDAVRYPGFRPARTGSGFLVDREGYLLSSDRAVRDDRNEIAAIVDVETEDGIHFEAAVVGTEPTLDLSVLKIAEPERLPDGAQPLPLGDSDRLRAGHWLIALADPPGAEKAFAVGVVSAPPARACYQEDLSATLIQSSLALPSRAAGGPIVDIAGRVVGIGIERSGGARAAEAPTGLLPINLALNLFESLKVAGSRRSPWIGVSVLEIPLARRRMGAQARSIVFPASGVYIDDVHDPSPAAKAGVRPGDFLLGLGGHRVLSVSDFQKWLYISGIGAAVELELQREGQPLRRTLPIEPRPESATTR